MLILFPVYLFLIQFCFPDLSSPLYFSFRQTPCLCILNTAGIAAAEEAQPRISRTNEAHCTSLPVSTSSQYFCRPAISTKTLAMFGSSGNFPADLAFGCCRVGLWCSRWVWNPSVAEKANLWGLAKPRWVDRGAGGAATSPHLGDHRRRDAKISQAVWVFGTAFYSISLWFSLAHGMHIRGATFFQLPVFRTLQSQSCQSFWYSPNFDQLSVEEKQKRRKSHLLALPAIPDSTKPNSGGWKDTTAFECSMGNAWCSSDTWLFLGEFFVTHVFWRSPKKDEKWWEWVTPVPVSRQNPCFRIVYGVCECHQLWNLEIANPWGVMIIRSPTSNQHRSILSCRKEWIQSHLLLQQRFSKDYAGIVNIIDILIKCFNQVTMQMNVFATNSSSKSLSMRTLLFLKSDLETRCSHQRTPLYLSVSWTRIQR